VTISVLSVASEAVPLVKTGGLADVAGALPCAVAPHDIAMTTFVPGYPSVLEAIGAARAVHRYDDLLGHKARILKAKLDDRPLFVLDAPTLFAREGGPYADAAGHDWGDNWRRFAAFSRAAADVAGGIIKGKAFDVLHAHDWQAAMALAYRRYAPDPKPPVRMVMTVHNIAFQGYFDAGVFPQLGLPAQAWGIDGVEYHGGVGYLKAGLQAADAITTVSPGYATEIRSAQFGMGLEGPIVDRGGQVSGIVNGIDPTIWNPETDPNLTARYSSRTLATRRANKKAVEQAFGLDRDEGPLFVVVGRLTWQKGMDLLLEAIDHLVGLGGRLALLGSGDPALEGGFHVAATRHPGRIGVRTSYDEPLSHLMQGGGDAILIPSRFEPCGLTQLYGLAYGCVPVVARTGGLADTVIDANVAALAAEVATGIQFLPIDRNGLAQAITRTVALYRQPDVWRRIQKRGMAADFSWARSGRAYADLYTEMVRAT
jgi:starch synthase